MIFRRNGNGRGHEESMPPVRRPVALLEPPREEYRDEAGMVWRCGRCGAMGTSRTSLDKHIWQGQRGCKRDDIREYVPREVYREEYEAKSEMLSPSGIWIVVKMPERTEEGSVASSYSSRVHSAKGGLAAIQNWYAEQIAELTSDSTEADREEANGRYVAIDFFTGHRCEALVTSDWRASVEVADGSYV